MGPSHIFPTNSGECQGVPVPHAWLLGHGAVLCPRQHVCYILRVDVVPLVEAVLNSGLKFSIADIIKAVKEDSSQNFVIDFCEEDLHLLFACIPLCISIVSYLFPTDHQEPQAASVG